MIGESKSFFERDPGGIKGFESANSTQKGEWTNSVEMIHFFCVTNDFGVRNPGQGLPLAGMSKDFVDNLVGCHFVLRRDQLSTVSGLVRDKGWQARSRWARTSGS